MTKINAVKIQLSEQTNSLVEGKITVLTQVKIPENMMELIEFSIFMLAYQLQCENTKEIIRCNCVFLNEEEDFTVTLDKYENNSEEVAMGKFMRFCVFPIKRWYDNKLTDIKIVTSILEELCHMYWSIDDETKVCYKVYDIMNKFYVKLKITDIYNKSFI